MTRFVHACGILGDHAFPAQVPGACEELRAVLDGHDPLDVNAPESRAPPEAIERIMPAAPRGIEQYVGPGDEQIEHHERDTRRRRRASRAHDPRPAGAARVTGRRDRLATLLKIREPPNAARSSRDQLTVEHEIAEAYPCGQRGHGLRHAGKIAGPVDRIPREQSHTAIRDHGQDANAVVLRLEHPTIAARHSGRHGGQHGTDFRDARTPALPRGWAPPGHRHWPLRRPAHGALPG